MNGKNRHDAGATQSPRVMSFGEILWDVIGGKEFIGGAPFNLAAHLARLGADSRMVSRVGRDERGKRALAEVKKLGMTDELIQRDADHPTGRVDVVLTAAGLPSYVIHEDVAYDHIEYSRELQSRLGEETFSAFCFGTLGQRSGVSRYTLHRVLDAIDSTEVFLDINLRQNFYSGELVRESLSRATVLKLNDEEAEALPSLIFARKMREREFAAAVSDEFGVDIVCITHGERGCRVFHGGAFETVPGVRVKVADTVGAGDAFGAGFLYRLCCGEEPYECARFGNRLGAFVASKRGAVPQYDGESFR